MGPLLRKTIRVKNYKEVLTDSCWWFSTYIPWKFRHALLYKNNKEYMYSPDPPTYRNLFEPTPRSKKILTQPGANRIYVPGPKPPKEPFELTLGFQRASVRERIYLLAYTLLGLCVIVCALACVTLLATHTRNLCYSLPLVGKAMLQVCYLKHSTQAQLT